MLGGNQSRNSQPHHPGGPGEVISSFRMLPPPGEVGGESIDELLPGLGWAAEGFAQEAGVSARAGPTLSSSLCG